MDRFLQLTMFGLVIGSVYAIAATGLVVTYTTSGIFNFAHGAMGMLSSFAYWQLRYDWGVPAPIALVAVLLVIAPALGALIEIVIMRGLQGTSEITKLVVPISVMLGFIALSTWIWNPNEPRKVDYFFGAQNRVTIFGVVMTYHELITMVVAIAIAVALRVLLYRTRNGVAMRAVVDDRSLLQLNGGRPDRASVLSWAIGAGLGALAGVLITPITGGSLNSAALTLLVINAYAAAMFGRLRSLPLTYLGGLLLGLARNYVDYIPRNWTWRDNLRPTVPMVMLFVILLLIPQERLRGTVVLRTRERFRQPTMRQAWTWAGVFVIVMYLLSTIMVTSAINLLTYGICLAIISLSLVLLTGYAGEVNFAALTFAGIGAVVLFHFGKVGVGANAEAHLQGYVLAAIVSGLVGVLIALPAVRLRGLYLGLATAAFAVFTSFMVFSEIGKRKIFGHEFSIFPQGTLNIPRPVIFGIDLRGYQAFYVTCTVVFALLGVGLIALRRNSFGRRLSAMKDSPAACATLGLNTVRLKLTVFALSAAIAGFGGALLGSQIGAITKDRFDLFGSLGLFMLVVVGGVGYVSGGLFSGILNGVAFVVIQNIFTKVGADYKSFSGLFEFLKDFTSVLPALIGVSLGRNPSGAVNGIIEGFAPLGRAKRLAFVGVGIEFVAYLLTWQGAISHWAFALFTIAMFLFWPRVVITLRPDIVLTPEQIEARRTAVPLELVGIERPFTQSDLDAYEKALALDSIKGPHPHVTPVVASLPDIAGVTG